LNLRSLSDVQYHGFLTRDLNRLAWSVCQDRPRQRRYVGHGSARGICLIFADDPETLLAAVTPAQRNGRAEGRLASGRRWLNDFCARTPRSPIAHFPRNGSSSFPVTFVCCGSVRRFEAAESGLDGSKPGFGRNW